MPTRFEKVVNEIDQTLAECERLLTPITPPLVDAIRRMPSHPTPPSLSNITQAQLLFEACILRHVPPGSAYLDRFTFARRLSANGLGAFPNHTKFETYRGILRAIRFDYANDHMGTFTAALHADLFQNQMAIAAHFMEEGFLPASAVTAGVVLEAHLRKLAESYNLPIQDVTMRYIRAERLNEDLKARGAYDDATAKQVTFWLGLRNAGAHPNDGAVLSKDKISRFIEDVNRFLQEHPA
ncbi:MAG: hypothetical protein ACYDFT_00160 [Thermoplasmata archaeon]